MANWITNTIMAKNIKTLDILDENGNIDFNKIIPEPVDEATCPKEYLYTENNPEHIIPSKEKPWFNWSKWRKQFWGVTCNADTDQIESNDVLNFDTKWNAPYPIIAKISKMLSDTELTHSCLNIDTMYGTIYKTVWKDGKMIASYESQFEYDLDPNAETDGEYADFIPTEISNEFNID